MIFSKFAAFLLNTFSEEHLWKAASGHLHCNKKHIYIKHILLSIYQYKVIFMKQKSVFKLVFLTVSPTKVSKLYFHKCSNFLLFLSLSTLFIHQFYAYTKILILIPFIPTPHFKVVFHLQRGVK